MSNFGTVISGYLAKISVKVSDTGASTARRLGVLSMTVPLESLRQFDFTSIKMECLRKKSAPRSGCETLATLKECFTVNPGRESVSVFVPKVSIKVPFAARRRCPGRGTRSLCDLGRKEIGITEMSAPLSIKNEVPEALSNTDIEPEETELREMMPDATGARLWRFPTLVSVV